MIDKILYLIKGKKEKIVFIGEQISLYQYLLNKNSYSYSPDKVYKTSFFKEEYLNEDEYYSSYFKSKRVVSFVIDRSDNDKIKVFACPISLWNKIIKNNKNNDFEIWKEGEGLETTYYANPLGEFKFSEELKDTVDKTLNEYDLSDIFVYNENWDVVSKNKDMSYDGENWNIVTNDIVKNKKQNNKTFNFKKEGLFIESSKKKSKKNKIIERVEDRCEILDFDMD